MKILKIFGLVVGIHVFALILIFASPGCSSTNKPTPTPADTVSSAAPAPAASSTSAEVAPVIDTTAATASPVTPAPESGDTAAGGTVGVRFSPTRPDTAAAAAPEAPPVGDVTPATTYTVVRGDSLWSIAKANHITVAEVAAANNLRASSPVKIGQKLIIPGKAMPANGSKTIDTNSPPPAAAAAVAAPKMAGAPVKHTVKPGETLGAIARKYQVKVGDIATANNIADPGKIRPGMVLIIPGWQAPAAKAASAAGAAGDATPPAGPAPGQDLDAGLKPSAGAPPVIQVEDAPPAATDKP